MFLAQNFVSMLLKYDWLFHNADATVKQRKQRRDLHTREMKVKPFTNIQPGNPDAVPKPDVTYNLANCDQYITPECLRALYNFSNGTLGV